MADPIKRWENDEIISTKKNPSGAVPAFLPSCRLFFSSSFVVDPWGGDDGGAGGSFLRWWVRGVISCDKSRKR
jgi:hypothetical protein